MKPIKPDGGCQRKTLQSRLRVSRPTLSKWIGLLKAYRNDEFQWREYNNRWLTPRQIKMLKAIKKLFEYRTEEQIIELLQNEDYVLE